MSKNTSDYYDYVIPSENGLYFVEKTVEKLVFKGDDNNEQEEQRSPAKRTIKDYIHRFHECALEQQIKKWWKQSFNRRSASYV